MIFAASCLWSGWGRVAMKATRVCASVERDSSRPSVSEGLARKERVRGRICAARLVSNTLFFGKRRSERQQPAATLDVRRAFRQSKRSVTNCLTSGSLGEKADGTELRRMEFFSQARAASNSRCWACRRIVRKRVSVARSCLLVSSVASARGARLVMKRLKMGSACGTTVA
jgi:hypothetical protein